MISGRAAFAGVAFVPELDCGHHSGTVLVSHVRVGVAVKTLVREMRGGIEPRLSADKHPERVLDRTVLHIILGRPLLVVKPLFQRPGLATVRHEIIIGKIEAHGVTRIPRMEASRQTLHCPPIGGLRTSPDQFFIPGCGYLLIVLDIILKSERLTILGLRLQKLVLAKIDHRLGGVGGLLPFLVVVGLADQLLAVMVLPVGINGVAVKKRACRVKKNPCLHGHRRAFCREAIVILHPFLQH